MKKILASVILSAITALLVSCPPVIDAGPVTIYHETYDSYNPVDWILENGAIGWPVVDDAGNNVLQSMTVRGRAVYSPFSSSDYTVSVRIKPGDPTCRPFLLARYVDDGSWDSYALMIDGSNPSAIYIIKVVNDSGRVGSFATFKATLDTKTYYTLKLKVSGSTITGEVTDGITTAATTYNDVANFGGVPAYTAGRAGIFDLLDGGGSHYDDFTITTP